jgi:hypothetical protein
LCLEIGHDSLRENPYLLDAVDWCRTRHDAASS